MSPRGQIRNPRVVWHDERLGVQDLEEVMGVTYQRGERGRCWVAYFLDTKPGSSDDACEEKVSGEVVSAAGKGGNYCVGVRYFPVADQAFESERQRAVELVKAHPLPDALFQVFDNEASEGGTGAEAAAEGGLVEGTQTAAGRGVVEGVTAGAGVRYLNTFASMPPSTTHFVQLAKMERRLQLLLRGTNPAVASAVAAAELAKHPEKEAALSFKYGSGAGRWG